MKNNSELAFPESNELNTVDYADAYAALAKAQGQFPPIPRDKTVEVTMRSGAKYTFKYAPLDTILTAVRPAMSANGLAILQTVEDDRVFSLITHTSGVCLKLAPVKVLQTEQGPQAQGSALSYSRRYSICLALSLVADEDNDANGAAGHEFKESRKGDPGKSAVVLIGNAEVEKIEKILADNKIDKGVFLKAVGASSVDAIPAGRVKIALGILEKRVKDRNANATSAGNPAPHTKNPAAPTGGTVNNLFINDNQVADLDALISEVKADKAAFLKYYQIKNLAALPAAVFKDAVEALEKKRSQVSQETSGSKTNVSTITDALNAKNIPFSIKDGAIRAEISLSDNTGKELLRSFGFSWASKERAWVLAQD